LINSINNVKIERFKNPLKIKDWLIEDQTHKKLNKLKKTNPEAFFYWYKSINNEFVLNLLKKRKAIERCCADYESINFTFEKSNCQAVNLNKRSKSSKKMFRDLFGLSCYRKTSGNG